MYSVLVTGGAGYIGSQTCKALAQAGFQPVSYDNLTLGHRWAVQWGPLEEGDLLDAGRLDQVLEQHKPVAAIHFAAFADVGESMVEPAKYYQNNLVGSLVLLDRLRAHGVRRVIFSSTCATYGAPKTVPISESQPQHPINPYGHSKRMVEQILSDYGRAYGMRFVALRYFNAAGADPDGKLGEERHVEGHLIPLVIGAALGTHPPLRIFGTDYETPDGTAVRDYIHVADLASAHLLSLRYLLNSGSDIALNLGTGSGVSVREIIAGVEAVSGKKVPFSDGPRRAGDPPILICDPTLARNLLGWAPCYSALETILTTAWNWHTRAAIAI